MLRRLSSLLPWLAVALAIGAVASALALAVQPGEIGPVVSTTGNGHVLHPIGRVTTVGDFPTASALTRDGHFAWVIDAGHGSDDVRVLDVATGTQVQTLPLPGAYGGVAFSPDGRHAYVSGTRKGDSPTEGPTKGDGGDVVHVFAVDPARGTGSELAPLTIPSSQGGSGRMNSLPPVTAAFPEGLAVSPDGRRLVVALNQADRVAIFDLASGTGSLVSVGAYPNGVAFDPQGRAYVSNEYDGTVSVLDAAAGRVLATVAGLGGQGGDRNSHPEGMVADPHRPAVYVAVTNRDEIATIDTSRMTVVKTVSVGRPQGIGTAPVALALAPDGNTLYSADTGEDAIAAVSLARRPAAGAQAKRHRVVQVVGVRSITRYRASQRRALRILRRALGRAHGRARPRVVAQRHYRTTLRRLRRRLLNGSVTVACAGPSRRQESAYTRAVLRALARPVHGSRLRRQRIGRARARAIARARARVPRVGACPALGFIPNLPSDALVGKLPTAAYPTAVNVTPDGTGLVWVAGKGLGSGPNPDYAFAGDKRAFGNVMSVYGTYVLDKLLGRVGVLSRPSDVQMRAMTPAADAQAGPAHPQAPPAGSPVVGPGGGPSAQIKHVFYIVRENRTYDQVFGSDPRGDGAPGLELFDDNGVRGPTGGITPNAHRLARTFPLLDHFYADSEVSVDGHVITAGAYATDYVQKALAANYSNRGRAFDFGVFPVSFPPKSFIFDQAVRQGISFRNYGEGGAGTTPLGNDGRPTYPAVQSNTDSVYPGNVQIGCLMPGGAVGNTASCTEDSGQFDGTGTPTAANSRVNEFLPQFQQQVATGRVPTFNYMILPNDHTNGTTKNDYSPQALVADNDLALGQIVDAISHSAIWPSTAIFVVEDDSQDGADHVDAHRMPALVISPWAKRGAVVPTRYDQYSMLRTMELITGLRPLALNDALATPMYDAFTGTPDVQGTRYTAVNPTQSLREINGAGAPLAARSNQLPWSKSDLVPQAISDQTLWKAVHGAASTPPPPGPNASPLEHSRALGVESVLRRHGNARAFLEHRGGDG